jgi:NhaC family Na+:H+ antiporter
MTVKTKTPHIIVPFLVILFLVGLLVLTIKAFGADSLAGGSQISLLITSGLCILLGLTCFGRTWDDFESQIKESIGGIGSAVIILLIIGALGGAWMISGVVPSLIYYGLEIVHPSIFLFATCIIAAIVSLVIGSSWTTIATIGVALIGIGQAHGFDPAVVAGAIISGAYFGDKMSPLSDTTVVAASSADTPLFEHIKYMVITVVPSMLITLIIFLIIGFTHQAEGAGSPQDLALALQERFVISPWLLLVPVVTLVLIAIKMPPILTLMLSTALAMVVGIFVQPDAIAEVAGGDDLFKGSMITLYGSTALKTDNALLAELISTNGMGGMLHTVWLVLCAMTFGACMKACGFVESMTAFCQRFIKNRVTLVGSTVTTGFFLNATTADQYLSIILTSSLFKGVFEKYGYENRLLSRSLEDGATVTSPLIPWSTCGMTHSTILGVSTFLYFPYCFFCYISPIVSIIVAATGYKIYKKAQVA